QGEPSPKPARIPCISRSTPTPTPLLRISTTLRTFVRKTTRLGARSLTRTFRTRYNRPQKGSSCHPPGVITALAARARSRSEAGAQHLVGETFQSAQYACRVEVFFCSFPRRTRRV